MARLSGLKCYDIGSQRSQNKSVWCSCDPYGQLTYRGGFDWGTLSPSTPVPNVHVASV